MHFQQDTAISNYCRQIRAFVNERLIPLESDPASYDEGEQITETLLMDMRKEARSEGLWCFQMPKNIGGQGVGFGGMAACYEEMNRSIFGPVVFNCAAPDDGNMMLLNAAATSTQKSRWLYPIVNGEVRSAFAMTEPAPGSGSDPAGAMLTRAEKAGSHWVIHGRKWFITGAGVASHFILVARTSNDSRKGLTAFMFHRDDPGWGIERRIPIMGPEEHGGHCELVFDGLQIPDANRLLDVGDGLKVTQMRLGPARLTHCMRWLGLARRSLEIAASYIEKRESFGQRLADREGVQWMMGEAALKIQSGRLLTRHAAWELDQGSYARAQISMAKITVADALHHAVDTAIQLCGALGYSRDTVLEWIYRYARQARLVDGASEVHKMVLSRSLLSEGGEFWDLS